MKLNFTPIKQSEKLPIIEIKVGDEIIDLHNACEFMGVSFILKRGAILTEWRYFPNYQENIYRNFEILFEGVKSFEIVTWDNAIPFEQNSTLDELAFDDDFPNRTELEFNGGLKILIVASSLLFQWQNESRNQNLI